MKACRTRSSGPFICKSTNVHHGHGVSDVIRSPLTNSVSRRDFLQVTTDRCGLRQASPNLLDSTAMIDLYDEATGKLIGTITDADLQVLVDALEEESLDDHDYYIDVATIDVIADGRATEHLVNLLRTAVGTKDGVDIRWQRR